MGVFSMMSRSPIRSESASGSAIDRVEIVLDRSEGAERRAQTRRPAPRRSKLSPVSRYRNVLADFVMPKQMQIIENSSNLIGQAAPGITHACGVFREAAISGLLGSAGVLTSPGGGRAARLGRQNQIVHAGGRATSIAASA